MAYALIASAKTAGSGTTTGAIDTTGATLLVAAQGWGSGGEATISDSKGNTWTAFANSYNDGALATTRLYYVANPTVGAGHTFSLSATGYPALAVAAFSGAALASPLDQTTGANANSGTTSQPGSITPTENNELAVTCITDDGVTSTFSIDSGYTVAQQQTWQSGVNYAVALAYLVQTSAAATNPTWTHTSAGSGAAIASFKASPTGGSGPATGLVSA